MKLAAGTRVEILKISYAFAGTCALPLDGMDFAVDNPADIGELDESDVFARCMEKRAVPEQDRPELMATYRRVLASIYEEAGA
jgi:exonuclease SbcD